MFDSKNSGYYGYSMSQRAKEAYDNGEKPLSKWTKSDILESYPKEVQEKLKKFNLQTLKYWCLYQSSWHHTGSHCQETNFYKIHEDLDPNVITPIESKPKATIEKNMYYHGTYEEKEYHPYSKCRFNKMKITIVSFKNAIKKGDWLIMPSGNKKRFNLCKIERTTKRKIK